MRIGLCVAAAALMAVAIPAALPAGAGGAPETAQAQGLHEWSAQARPRRARTRLRVYYDPRRPLYRDCAVRYVRQWRPSGTVIVPDFRCWWVRN